MESVENKVGQDLDEPKPFLVLAFNALPCFCRKPWKIEPYMVVHTQFLDFMFWVKSPVFSIQKAM